MVNGVAQAVQDEHTHFLNARHSLRVQPNSVGQVHGGQFQGAAAWLRWA